MRCLALDVWRGWEDLFMQRDWPADAYASTEHQSTAFKSHWMQNVRYTRQVASPGLVKANLKEGVS